MGRKAAEKPKKLRKLKNNSESRLILIRKAAKMRASGCTVDEIAAACSRSTVTIHSWMLLDCWPAMLREECRKVEELLDIELGPVAAQALRRNIEDADGMTSNMALATFYRTRHATRKLAFDAKRAEVEFELKRLEIEGKRGEEGADGDTIDTTATPVLLDIASPHAPALSDHDD